MLFKEMVAKNKLEQPTSRKFSLDKWNKAYKKVETPSRWDTSVYEAGLFFHGLFKFLREELGTLYENVPKDLTNDKLILLLCGYANEQQYTAVQKTFEALQKTRKLSELTIASDVSNAMFNAQEARQTRIDSIEIALKVCFDRKNKDQKLLASLNGEKSKSVDFMVREYMLSQLYAVYESFWKAIVYSDFFFQTKERECLIVQIPTPDEVAIQYNQVRQEKISMHERMYIVQNYANSVFPSKLKIIYKDKNTVKVKRLNDASYNEKVIYLTLTNEFMNIFSELSNDILKKTVEDISLQSVFDVFLQLVLFAYTQNGGKEEKSSSEFIDEQYLMDFFPKIDLMSLTTALSESLNIKYEIISKIIDFLSYNSGKDLWGHPIINIDSQNIGLLNGPLDSPHIVRLVEAWSSILEINIGDKGFYFEKIVRKEVNDCVKKNHLIKDYEEVVSKTINLSTNITKASRGEEIDFLMRIGNKILLADMKSVITSDSIIAHYNAIKTLEHGVEQVLRKSNYIKTNLKLTFEQLQWKFDPNENYEVIPFVINSKGLYSGFSMEGIPIADLSILTQYFKSSKVRLVTDDNKMDLAWSELYNDFGELVENFQRYLLNPPQIMLDRSQPVVYRDAVAIDFGTHIVSTLNFRVKELTISDILINNDREFLVKHDGDINKLLDILNDSNTKIF